MSEIPVEKELSLHSLAIQGRPKNPPLTTNVDFYALVQCMYEQFEIPEDQSTANVLFRSLAMHEEINELGAATLANDRVAQLDAIVDLLVFAFGTAITLGFSNETIRGAYLEVMLANLEKVRAGSSADSKRGWQVDLTKPPGWKAPDLTRFINPAKYRKD